MTAGGLVERLMLVGLVAGCGDPAAPEIPDLSDGSMRLFSVLIADSVAQTVIVDQTDGLPLVGVEGMLSEVAASGELVVLGTAVATPLAPSRTASLGASLGATGFRSGSFSSVGVELTFPVTVIPGRRYHVRVTAPGRPTASATTIIPGDFAITSIVASGDPPGTGGLELRWSPSAGAFRYIVRVRAEPDCVTQAPACESIGVPWAAATDGPSLSGVVPDTALPAGRTEAVEFAVYAANRELIEYLTTGVGGPFTVLPKQNVVGGYGVVGAWVRRHRSLVR